MKLHEKNNLGKLNSFIYRRIAEAPSLYDSISSQESAERLEKYLRNKKGFYDANVSYEPVLGKNKAFVDYNVALQNRSYVKNAVFIGNDFNIIKQLIEEKEKSLIKPGTPIDAFEFDLEKQRIVNYLQNRGYANFNSNHIAIKGDSTNYGKQVEVFIEILNPSDSELHKRFQIGEINVYTDKNLEIDGSVQQEKDIGERTYLSYRPKFLVKPKLLDKKVFLEEGQIYNKDDYYTTIRKLTNLSAYRFVKMTPRLSEVNDTILNYDILLSPQTNRWVSSLNNDVYYSTLNNIGLSLGGSIQNRNAFRGSEVYSLSGEAGVEFNLQSFRTDTIERIRTATFSLQNKFAFPKFIDLYNSLTFVNNLGLVSDIDAKKIRDNAETEFNLGYTYNNAFNYNTLVSFNFSYGFDYRANQNDRVFVNQTGIDLILYTEKSQAFLDDLANNQLLANSFNDNLFTGFFFQEIAYVRNLRIPNTQLNLTSLIELEVSGLEIAGVNYLYNNLFNSQDTFRFSKELDFANFVKLEIDERFNRVINDRSSLAFRLLGGIAFKYGDDDAVPYIRQFFNGGPSSLRGWQPRELGPGSYFDGIDRPPGFRYFQAGDFKLESSIEYRFDIASIFEGAIFADAGNIWTLAEDPDRPGAQLSSQFYKQIAMNVGYGLRLDFSYFIIRFDFGYRIRNPYITADSPKYWLNPFEANTLLGNSFIAINYPF